MDRPHSRSPFKPVIVLVLGSIVLLLLVPAVASAATRTLGGGTATFHLDGVEIGTLMGRGLVPYADPPAALLLSGTTARLTMPITGGTRQTGKPKASFRLSGGESLVFPFFEVTMTGTIADFMRFTMRSWRVSTGTGGEVSVVAGGKRQLQFLDETRTGTLSIVTIRGHKFVKVRGVALTYNTNSSTLIGGFFAAGPAPGDPFGTLTLLARLR